MQCREFSCALLVSLMIAGCGGGGSGEVIVFNPGDGLPVESFKGMDVADLNGDGLIDIVAASNYFDGVDRSEQRLNVFLQDPAVPGNFLPRSFVIHDEGESIWQVAAVDLTLDDRPEILIKPNQFAGFSVFEQDPANAGGYLGPQRFEVAQAVDVGFSGGFDVGDIDGDVYPDVVMTFDDELVYFRQESSAPGAFNASVTVGEGAGEIKIGDMDGDGFNDLVTFARHPNDKDIPVEDTWHYHRQSFVAPGSFFPPMAMPLNSIGWGLAIADLTNDGYMDVAINSTKGDNEYMTVFAQTPFGAFDRLPVVATTLDGILGDVTAADLDGDGAVEIIAGMTTGAVNPDLIQIYRQDAGGTYFADDLLSIPYPPVGQPFMYAVRVADFNGDGQPDIAVSDDEIFIFFQRTGSPGVFDIPTKIAAQR